MLSDLRQKLQKHCSALSKSKPSEGTTISVLVMPALHDIGWNNPPEFWVEMDQSSVTGNRPDLVLVMNGKVQVGIEVKSLGSDLDSKKHMSQAVGYAADIKVRWMILTDGFRWDAFDCKYLTERDAEELRILSTTLDSIEWEQLAAAILPEAVGNNLLERQSAQSTLIPRAQERLQDVMQTVPRSFVELVLPAKEFGEFEYEFRRSALSAAIASILNNSEVAPEAHEPLPITTTTGHTPACYLLPVSSKNSQGETAVDVVAAWLKVGYWGLNKGTAYRSEFKAGDRLCFYASSQGVCATATATGPATDRQPPSIKRISEFYIPLKDCLVFKPRPLTEEIRLSLEIMKNKGDSARKYWVWLVQGTTKIPAQDFARITGQTIEKVAKSRA